MPTQEGTSTPVIPVRPIAEQLGIKKEETSFFLAIRKLEKENLNIQAYKPNMPTIGAVHKATSELISPLDTPPELPVYFLPHFDVSDLSQFPCLQNAVLQVDSRTNGNESFTPSLQSPLSYLQGTTHGMKSQMLDPVAAVARFRAELNAGDYKKIEAESNAGRTESYTRDSGKRDIIGCDSLFEWRKQNEFVEIFDSKDGLISIRDGQEEKALDFLKAHLFDLRINVERVNLNASSLVQVLNFPFSRTHASSSQIISPSKTRKDRNQRNIAQQKLKIQNELNNQACQLLLTAQYELVAEVAILEAKQNPHRRIPLILTLVGFNQNSPEAIYNSVAAAIKKLIASGVTNVDCCISTLHGIGEDPSIEIDKIKTHLKQLKYRGMTITREHLKQPQLPDFNPSPQRNSAPVTRAGTPHQDMAPDSLQKNEKDVSIIFDPTLPLVDPLPSTSLVGSFNCSPQQDRARDFTPKNPTSQSPVFDPSSTHSTPPVEPLPSTSLFWAFIRHPASRTGAGCLLALGLAGLVCSVLSIVGIIVALNLIAAAIIVAASAVVMGVSATGLGLSIFAGPHSALPTPSLARPQP